MSMTHAYQNNLVSPPAALPKRRPSLGTAIRSFLGLVHDQRTHRRLVVALKVRFMTQDRKEFEAQVIDISAGGARVHSRVVPVVGDKVVLQIDNIGRIIGRVMRHEDGGFGVRFEGLGGRRERLVERMIWQANRDALGLSNDDRHSAELGMQRARVYVGDSAVMPCTVLDLSLRGVSLAMNSRPEIGAEVRVGRLHGEVVRHHALGIDVEFDEPAGDLEDAELQAQAA